MKRFQSISENLSYNDILQLDGAFSASHINYGKSPLFNGENSKDLAKNSRKNSVSSLEHVEDVFEYMTHFNGVENDFKKADRIVLWEKYWLEYTNAFEHLTEVLPKSVTTAYMGSEIVFEIADVIEEVPTVCWCGKRAQCNTRYADGKIVRKGAQVMLGLNESYVALCRKHYKEGQLWEHDPGDIPGDNN